MTELEMYELWCTLRVWANYNQLMLNLCTCIIKMNPIC